MYDKTHYNKKKCDPFDPKKFFPVFFKLIGKWALRLTLSIWRKEGLVKATANCNAHALTNGGCPSGSGGQTHQEGKTTSARRHDLTGETAMLGLYMKFRVFKCTLKAATAVCQSGPAGTSLHVLPHGTVDSLRARKESYSLVCPPNPVQWLGCSTFSLSFG